MAKGIAAQPVKVVASTRRGYQIVRRTVYEVRRVPRGLIGECVLFGERVKVKVKFSKKAKTASEIQIGAALLRGELLWTRLWTEKGKEIWA